MREMFLIMGVSPKSREYECADVLPCHRCEGKQGYMVLDTYSVFHAFFLPVWTWGHQYHVKCSACGSLYQLKDKMASQDMKKCPQLSYWDLELVEAKDPRSVSLCSNCGFQLDKDFEFCPKCGMKKNRT